LNSYSRFQPRKEFERVVEFTELEKWVNCMMKTPGGYFEKA